MTDHCRDNITRWAEWKKTGTDKGHPEYKQTFKQYLMETVHSYEKFPLWIVLLSNLSAWITYLLGFFIINRLGLIYSLLYLCFVLVLEYRLIRNHCVHCYYWGKRCGFGKGSISSLFFRKGNSVRFCIKEMSWKAMIPDLLVVLLPVVTGIMLMIIVFDILLLSAVIGLVALTTFGNGYIRGKLTCRHCKQRELGCPAEKLFNKG